MSTKNWFTAENTFPNNGATPLVQDSLMLFTGNSNSTSLRERLQIEFSVTAGGAGSGVAVNWWQEVQIAVAAWRAMRSSPPATSPTPISAPVLGPPEEWLTWDLLTPRVQVYDQLSPFLQITWNPPKGEIEAFSRRKCSASLTPTTWLAWEVNDPLGVINTTIAGNAYNLGCTFSYRQLDETF